MKIQGFLDHLLKSAGGGAGSGQAGAGRGGRRDADRGLGMAITSGKVLMVAAVAEIATGLALLVAPSMVGQLL